MSVLSGFIKTIKYRLTDAGYKWQSEKTSSQTVVMGDGTDNTDTVESRFGNIKGITTSTTESKTGKVLDASTYATNVGAIQGITSSLATDNENYALSASAGKDLQDQITDVNSNLIAKEKPITITNVFENVSTNICYSSGFVKRIMLIGTITAVANQYVKIGTIPYTPNHSLLKSVNLNIEDVGWLSFNESGEISVLAKRTGSVNIYIDETLI